MKKILAILALSPALGFAFQQSCNSWDNSPYNPNNSQSTYIRHNDGSTTQIRYNGNNSGTIRYQDGSVDYFNGGIGG